MRGTLEYTNRAGRALDELAKSIPNLDRRLAEELAQATREANRIERLMGRDAEGAPLRPVRTRVGRYAASAGPAMVPDGDASGAIAGFVANAVHDKAGRYTLTAGHRGRIAQILAWHGTGRAGTGRPITKGGKIVGFRGIPGAVSGIRRDVRGIGPQGMAGIREVFAKHPSKIVQVLRAGFRKAAAFVSNL